ncbi:enoyl-CoA hydratase-related protein [Nocardia bovistercoris]|uniref:Enoyl-CoA hydratase/isomerase family protein n=1 Tax=Nocardia bovistercoris TaxID=2785916 RepID=A0A931N7R8_9NOCA|nr:enoyl-CoA hydratase-related protein [Nocardia bovistercoris]MBH0781028.1 enoyl-CoA hydratase/isomerase family protein [Nocardia bovistercoris]
MTSAAGIARVVRLDRDGEIAVIRLHRPDRLNAFNRQMRDELLAAFDECDRDDGVRAIVMTGSGRAYCAGADLVDGADTFVAESDDAGAIPPDVGGEVSLRIHRSYKPVVVAVNGPAVGVGVTSTLPADIRIASDTARFGFVFTRRGLVPEACSSWFLPRIVGISTALTWTLSGRMVSASEALDHGLVSEVLPPERLLPRALEIARSLVAGTSPVSVAMTRELLWRMLGAESPEVAHHAESRGIHARARSGDLREGVDAFLAKREPVFADSVADGLPVLFDR